MKTKITILLTALLMLFGISVNAQVKNQTPKRAETTTPIKGDVNEDGVVDVADINAIIEIMKNGGGTSGETKYYWYVGTTKPTSLSEASQVNTYESEIIYTNNSGSKAHIFALTDDNHTVTFINIATNNPVSQLDVDTTTLPGYRIFETGVGTANGGRIKILIN